MTLHIDLAIPEGFSLEDPRMHIHLDVEDDERLLLLSLLTEEESRANEGPGVTLTRAEALQLAATLLHVAENYLPDLESDDA